MDKRFGVKDFVLFILIAVLIGTVLLGMKQYDREWTEIRGINAKLDDQVGQIQKMREILDTGVVPAAHAGQSSGTQEALATVDQDPFPRLHAAEKLPDYARGDWFVDAFAAGIAKLTPLMSSDLYASEVQNYVLESLGRQDRDTLEWKPMLSTGWTSSDDGMKITFTMRDGVRFSDGEPLTADDVVFTYNFIMNPKIADPRDQSYLKVIKSVEKKGNNEVVFTFAEPYFQAFDLAAGLSILPKHFYEKFAIEDFNQSVGYLMGSGPYCMEDPTGWKPGTLIQLVRNEKYWGVQPGFDRLIWQEITNEVAHLTAFKNGDIDHFAAVPEQYVEMIKDPELLKRTQHYEYFNLLGGYAFVAWNELRDSKPTRFTDKRVRQAMTMLVDRQRMIDKIVLGYGVLATGPFSPASKQCDPTVQAWPYDVARARQLLAEAGFSKTNDEGILLGPDGKPFEFKLTYSSGSPYIERIVLFLKDAYAKAGIKLDPDPLEWAIFTDRLDNKNFDAITLLWSASIETDLYQIFHSSQMVAGGDDFMSYKNPELDQTIEAARRTIQEGPRMKIWQQAHRIIHEDQPYTFLWYGKSLQFFDQRIHNVHIAKLGWDAPSDPAVELYVPRNQQKREK